MRQVRDVWVGEQHVRVGNDEHLGVSVRPDTDQHLEIVECRLRSRTGRIDGAGHRVVAAVTL